jgi:hypothetical protein
MYIIGLTLYSPTEGQSLQSAVRRGWYFGSHAFRERLLALLPKAGNVRIDQGQHYEAALLMKDAAEEKAERIFTRELQAAGLSEKALQERTRSEPLKWKIARSIRAETTVSLGWIARRLDLGSASNVCHKLRGSSILKSFSESVRRGVSRDFFFLMGIDELDGTHPEA